MSNILFLAVEEQNLHNAYTPEQLALGEIRTNEQLTAGEPMPEVEYIFSTWGMARLTEEQIARLLPGLKAVFYAAGTVQYFARPFLNRGVRVFSAWAANAVPVAEWALGQILLANKGFFQLDRRYRREGFQAACAYASHFVGNYGARVGLLGAGMVGRKLIELLKPFRLEVLVFDPFLPEEKAAELGVRKATLEEIFETCPVVSNHLANNAQTKGMLNYDLFSRMSPWGVFINTGRNGQVVVPDLIRAMKEEPGRMAVIDVTDPEEPLPADHPLWDCENILITPHRAGSQRWEIYRMGSYMFEEYEHMTGDGRVRYEVTPDMLATMA